MNTFDTLNGAYEKIKNEQIIRDSKVIKSI
jgi:hypothetical protein